MNELLIEMATAEDGQALSRALSAFFPEVEQSADGHCCVAVELWDEMRAQDVYAALDRFLGSHLDQPALSITVSLG